MLGAMEQEPGITWCIRCAVLQRKIPAQAPPPVERLKAVPHPRCHLARPLVRASHGHVVERTLLPLVLPDARLDAAAAQCGHRLGRDGTWQAIPTQPSTVSVVEEQASATGAEGADQSTRSSGSRAVGDVQPRRTSRDNRERTRGIPS